METNNNYDMYIPTRVMFGEGMLNKLGDQPMPGRRALIIISNGKSTRANGYLARTKSNCTGLAWKHSFSTVLLPIPLSVMSMQGQR